MRFPKAFHETPWVGIGRGNFVRRPLHQAHLQTTPRNDIDHRHFFGHAHGIGSIRNRRPEGEQAHMFGDAGENRHGHHHRGVEAGQGAMVLVEHNVDAQLVAELEFIVVPMIDVRPYFGVVVFIGHLDSERSHLVGFVPGLRIGHLGKMPDFHRLAPRCRAHAAANCLM